MAFIPTGITSIVNTVPSSVQVGVSIMGQLPAGVQPLGSIAVLQGTNPWQVNVPSPSTIAYQLAGSILAVSGSFSATPQGSIIAIQSGGSVQAVRTDNASVVAVLSNSSVAALQGTNPWQVNVPTPSYIAYQLAGSVMAVAATVNTGNSSVQLLGGVAVIGSVATLQGTSPWLVNMPSPSVISYQAAGSIMAVSATVNTGNSSVQLLNGVAAIGSVAVLQGTNPWQINMPSPSIIAYQAAGSVMAVSATVNTGNSSVQLLGGVAVIGSVATLQGTNPWLIGNSSVQIVGPSSNNSVITVVQGSISTAITNISASIIATQGTNPWVIGSIVGTYAEDAASGNNDKGIFTLGVRNDSLSSLVSADGDYTGWGTDSAGRHLIKPFVSEDGSLIDFSTSIVSTSVTLIAASVIGKKSYITDFWISNTGSVQTLITWKDGTTSILGYTTAPGGSGSNSPGINRPIKTLISGTDLTFQAATATSVLYVTVKGYQAQ